MLLKNIKSMDERFTLEGEEEEQDPTIQFWLTFFAA
jgi:hypothetical protein